MEFYNYKAAGLTPCMVFVTLSTMHKNRIVVVSCLSLLALGGVMYVAQDSLMTLVRDSQNFLGGFLVEPDTALLNSQKSAQESNTAKKKDDSSAVGAEKCAFTTSQTPALNLVRINEIAWTGMPGNAKDEWIELKNISSKSVALAAWQLLNQSGTIKIVFNTNVQIAPGGFYLLGRQKIIAPGIEADAVYSGALNNTGDHLEFFDSACRLMDEVVAISAWSAGDNKTKKTMERNSKNFGWHTSTMSGGTPKQENSPLAEDKNSGSVGNPTPPTVPPSLCSLNSQKTLSHEILINEVAWAGTGSATSSQEWIEFKNTSGASISLAGWQLQNANQSIKVFFNASDSIPAGGFYLLERGSSDFISGVKADKFFTNAIKNNDEALRLFDEHCAIIDEVVAHVGGAKNWPAGTVGPDYRTAERSNDASWYTYSASGVNGIFGTPRAENSPTP